MTLHCRLHQVERTRRFPASSVPILYVCKRARVSRFELILDSVQDLRIHTGRLSSGLNSVEYIIGLIRSINGTVVALHHGLPVQGCKTFPREPLILRRKTCVALIAHQIRGSRLWATRWNSRVWRARTRGHTLGCWYCENCLSQKRDRQNELYRTLMLHSRKH